MKYLNNCVVGLLAFLSFLSTSCDKRDDVVGSVANLPEGTEFDVFFGMGDEGVEDSSIRGSQKPKIANLFILVFDENHRFVCRRKAVLTSIINQTSEYPFFSLEGEAIPPSPSADNQIQKFTATLVSSEKHRYIHFVANYDWPNDYPQDYFLKGKDEGEIMAALKTDKEVFWRKIELSRLQPSTFNNKVVRLLRNQARVLVSVKERIGFQLLGYALYNVPDKGTVAPFVYDTNAPAGHVPYSFPSTPIVPTEPAGFKLIVPTESDVTMPTDRIEGRRLFEYDNHGYEKKAFVIIKGKKRGKSEGYYKIDLKRDPITGELYDIIRNMSYHVLISSVINEGYSTLQEAAENPAGNNLLASVELSDILSISDGENTLHMDKLGGVYVKPGKFETTITYTGTTGSSDNSLNHISFQLLNPEGQEITDVGDSYLSKPNLDKNTGMLSIQIKKTPTEGNGDMLYNLFVIGKSPVDGSILLRKMPFLLTQPYDFKAKIKPEKNPNNPSIGDDVTICFEIPKSMPNNAFPFEVLLEVTNLTPSLAAGHNNYMTIVLKDKKFYYSYIVKSDVEIGKTQMLYFKRNEKNTSCRATLLSEYYDNATVSL